MVLADTRERTRHSLKGKRRPNRERKGGRMKERGKRKT